MAAKKLNIRRTVRWTAIAARLASLHFASHRMKHKLRVLSRRHLTLIREIENLANQQAATSSGPSRQSQSSDWATEGPIFVHSAWRAGSTYFWNKFRSSPRYLAYYEPFHESLETLTASAIETATSTSWPCRHPVLDAPYYKEYSNLLEACGGVKNFQWTFPYLNYFLHNEPLPDQQAYLNALSHYAKTRRLRPVFGFCRSIGRMPWFSRYMPGVHIALTRDALGMWRSALDRKKAYDDLYFLARPLLILFVARRDPWIARYFAALGLGSLPRISDSGVARRQAEQIVRRDLSLTTRAFAAVFALGTALSQRHADIVISMEALSTELGCRAISETLIGRYDIDLNWRDCRIPVYSPCSEDELFLDCWNRASILAERSIPHPHPHTLATDDRFTLVVQASQ